ncbi:bifunctional [glutamate--ammonia ligase]-adenylyl-L-tyrosine phosphorylase/[glutamate--ammonia-ligase] adenylyltransferase [Hydrogenophaga sp.]|uniref:bifunctional [glutamate--ammonia ligase]-adenylyl-L-tyrosine phosphorylase/[glutamate--ammonia-ligase] adenylyltransferase n=1 Tax=Hydrogenophaga sp. TaxID=1904254 RepID=UPI0026127DB6|nr:bifunctional [glutamate--ammonia ligase]-adenylyl-L-tyrosine phosphorylase/[glutamate--ammonia-ligase] adenylyltransferase [Hydrogenophaga sp.]MDM7949020.1 bifunctional [glutamate--ammonia ligase]-adenylyl-L-tyrosine phosphorylase/[glutamate--ammonia-ligase] adenylyltransferase [Hydrogenophaga sp.]
MTVSHATGSAAAHSTLSTNVTSSSRGVVPLDNPGAFYSRFVQRVRRRFAAELGLLPAGVPVRASMQTGLEALQNQGLPLPAALRVLRQLVMERLAVLDCEHSASLTEVTRSMTELAELALDVACTLAFAELDAVHGEPRYLDAQGDLQRAQLWVIGMGKLGARELNVSSDIDLIYVYDEDGETAGNAQGRGRISNHEYFGKAVKHIYNTVGESTEHGNVFRVDLALRPNGNSGPSAVSLGALEEYFLVQGREWERFAWLKSRVIAPAACIASQSASALRSAVLPFVFRRYLDYNVFDALRNLHRQIREHAAKRAAGNPGRANDVKLSRGGIREIEFTVQLLQVVRGGQFPELRTRPTMDALARLARAQLMPPETAHVLGEAYQFLRRVEHRIQYLDDQQTHTLPTRDDDLAWLAATMGCASVCEFLHTLDAHRETVAHEFDTLLGGAGQGQCKGKGCNGGTTTTADLTSVLPQLPEAFSARVAEWVEQPRFLALREDARVRLVRLIERTGAWLEEGRVTETAALRMADWIEPLFRRESYLALLQERPAVHERLLRLLGAARWPARYLVKHPGVIDELANQQMLLERFSASQFEAELTSRRAALQSTGEDDEEELLNLLRRAHHAEVFRTLARDLEKKLTVEEVADDLSALADAVLRVATQWCWARMKNRHCEVPRIAIIAYGKLGGKELGYGSDLDIVFVYEDDHENAGEIYATFVRKLINWLTVKTGEGDLYEIDTALRPNGNSGLLVTSFEAYERYQLQRGTNTAWTWEHQAMTRARFVMGWDEMTPTLPAARGALPPEGVAADLGRPGDGGLTPTLPAARGALPPEGVAADLGRPGDGGLTPTLPAARGALPPEGAAADLGLSGAGGSVPTLRERFDTVREAVITAERDADALATEIRAMRQKIRSARPVRGELFDVKHSAGGMVDVEFAVQYIVLAHSRIHAELRPNTGNIKLLRLIEAAGLVPSGVGEAAALAYRELRMIQHRARLDEVPTQIDKERVQEAAAAVRALWLHVLGAEPDKSPAPPT